METARQRSGISARSQRQRQTGNIAARISDAALAGEERFRTLVDTIPAAVFMYGNYQTTYVNRAAVEISGYSREELLNVTDFWKLVHPESQPRLMEFYAAAMRGETIPKSHEFRIITKRGEPRWIQFNFDWVAVGPEEGVLLGIAFDITDRKEAEEAARRKAEQLEAVFNAFPDLLLRLDGKNRILEFTASPNRPLYRPLESFLGKAASRVLPPAVTTPFTRAVRQVRSSGESATIEYALPFPGGERLFETHIMPFQDDELLVLARDVTEQKQAINALREGEARLSAFAHAVPDLVFLLDEDGRYVEIMGADKPGLLARDWRELKGRRLHEVIPKKHADEYLRLIKKTVQTQQPQVLEYELVVTAGRRWFEGRTAPLGLKGRPRMVVWLARDITDRKQAEAALVAAREKLDRKAERLARKGNRHNLTFRELTVLQLLVSGKSDKEIGATLGISPLTVNKHVGNLMRKMKVRSRTAASVIAVRDGLAS